MTDLYSKKEDTGEQAAQLFVTLLMDYAVPAWALSIIARAFGEPRLDLIVSLAVVIVVNYSVSRIRSMLKAIAYGGD